MWCVVRCPHAEVSRTARLGAARGHTGSPSREEARDPRIFTCGRAILPWKCNGSVFFHARRTPLPMPSLGWPFANKRTGFCTGLVISIFSRTFVFLLGLLAASFQVCLYPAARYYPDICDADKAQLASSFGFKVSFLKAANQTLSVRSSAWPINSDDLWFRASFALSMILAAFVRL